MTKNQAFVASLDDSGISDYWRLCTELTIKQAALLIIGIDPDSETGSNCDNWKTHERPRGYGAVKQALSMAACISITCDHFTIDETDFNGNVVGEIPGSTDIDRSTVNRDSVADWLKSQGVRTGFFFPDVSNDAPDYLDPRNPRYAPKLAAAVSAWLAVEVALPTKSEKQTLEIWLRAHAGQFGLVDGDGNPVKKAMEECSSVANWNPTGGATPTPGA